MLKRTIILLTTVLLLVSSYTFAQNKPAWPKTFLWRISGNGLTKDSYLYGTMHVQDKRLFNFGDSLYRYMEKADGYAMELDLTEMMDTLIQRLMDERQRYSADDEKLANSKYKRQYLDSLVSNVKTRRDKASKKILERIRDSKRNAVLKQEMPTMMDAFLYGIARRQGKWLGGIEDLQDQLPVLDELGAAISTEELLSSQKEVKSSYEKMVSIYVSKDLNEIESYLLKDHSEDMEDLSLIKRNFKMARRMDSLANARSMFFTVGVAHLPGDSGVITLLRKRGFRLDPIFPTNPVDPLQYVSTLKSVNWLKVADENKSYEIEMPGKPADLSIASGMVKMKYFIDMSTLTMYMTTSTVVPDNINLDDFVKLAAKNQNAVIDSKKTIELSGLKGIETHIYSNTYYFKTIYLLRGNILYMVFVGAQKKESLEGADADHFLASFSPSKELPVAAAKTWKLFNQDNKGCSILFPGEARRNPKMPQGTISNWTYYSYDLADVSSGTYYILQIRDIVSGMHLLSDSSTFDAFRDRLVRSLTTITLNEETTFKGYPALKYEGVEANGALFKSMVINRGNRCYYVMTEGQKTTGTTEDMNKFLSSFDLQDYQYAGWQNQVQSKGNFQALAPAPFMQSFDTTAKMPEKDRPIHFVSYDSVDCSSYEILKYKVSPYYYATNDSALFYELADSYRKETDSLISEKWVTNGNLKGQEWIAQSPGNNIVKRSRIFISGDTLYYITSYLPYQKAFGDPCQRFFTSFKVNREELNTGVYKRKIEKILTDLQSTDSATFSGASEAFSKARLIKSDKSLLEEALLKEYRDDDASSYNVRDRIIDSLQRLMDDKSVDFIKKNFPGLTGKKEFMKMGLLDLLVRYQTQYSFDVFKELLLKHTPQNSGSYVLTNYLEDSLELSKSLYPEILELSNNPLFAVRLMGLTSDMVENKIIPLSMLDPYKQRFIKTADTIFDNNAQDDAEISTYRNLRMLSLIQQLNDAEGNRILKKYLANDDLDIKQTAIEGLLKNGQTVDPKEILKVAAEKSYRKNFYEQLHKIGKSALFPAAYNTQQSIAEADIYDYSTTEDYTPSDIKSLGVKTINYKGKSYKIYLFRVIYDGENAAGKPVKETYLGMSGPFSMDSKDLIVQGELTTIFFDAEYDAKKDQAKIDAYIRQSEIASEVKEE